MSKSSLILVDIQNGFCPGGALAVPEGDAIVPIVNQLLDQFECNVATQDWHPAGHASFASTHGKEVGEVISLGGVEQYLWPDHCVQETHGAEFHSALDIDKFTKVIQKGTNINIDSYSAFFDNAKLQQTGLYGYLQQQGVKTVYIAGLATDYCVKFTAFDAADLGFNVHVITDACRGVNISPGDIDQAYAEMARRGIKLIESADLL